MKLKKQFFLNILGNIIEFYDFTLFAFLSSVMAPLYFPTKNPLTSVLMALSVFGVSFFMRPVGAVFFGYLGDTYGRRVALKLTIAIMSFTSFAFAVLPTYQDIGWVAPVLFVSVRLLQGFSVGGEYAGAVVSTLEGLPKNKIYLIGSYVTCSSVVGTLIASLVTVALLQPGMPVYAWRFGYVLGGVMGVGVYVMVAKYMYFPPSHAPRVTLTTMVGELWSGSRMLVIAALLMAGFSGAFFYTAFSLASVIMISVRHWSVVWAHMASIGGMVTYLIFVPIFARLANRYGGLRVINAGIWLTLTVGTASLLLILHGSTFTLVMLGAILLSFCCAASQAPINGLICMAFPRSRRYTGFGSTYGIGISVFGGITGMILVRLVLMHDSGLWAVVYLQAITLIAAGALRLGRRHLSDSVTVE